MMIIYVGINKSNRACERKKFRVRPEIFHVRPEILKRTEICSISVKQTSAQKEEIMFHSDVSASLSDLCWHFLRQRSLSEEALRSPSKSKAI